VSEEPTKKPKRTSPTQRSLAHLRKRGYRVAIVERWNPHAKRRIDLFGFGDLLAIGNGEVVIVQTTTGANMAARRTKMQALDEYRECLKAGMVVELHGWQKMGERGKRKLWAIRGERHRMLEGQDDITVEEIE
jgi:hypothetical protein